MTGMKLVAIALGAGVLIGGASVETFHRARDRQRREVFAQRLRCKSLAEDFAKNHTSSYLTMFVQRSDYSLARNTCIASDSMLTETQNTFDVVDVITGEVLSTSHCERKEPTSSSFCGNGKDIALTARQTKAFEEALK